MAVTFLCCATVLVALAHAAQPINARVAALLANMTIEEKVAQLWYGSSPTYNLSELLQLMPHGIGALAAPPIDERNAMQATFMNSTRLGIPVSFYGETMRSGGALNVTIFPTPALLGCTWNVSLVEAIGRAVAVEAWSKGIDRSFSPVIQVTTDPRWGRVAENFGEAELLVALMGAAETLGLLVRSGRRRSPRCPLHFFIFRLRHRARAAVAAPHLTSVRTSRSSRRPSTASRTARRTRTGTPSTSPRASSTTST